MFKKISVLLLFTCLLLSAGGCGNGQQAAEDSASRVKDPSRTAAMSDSYKGAKEDVSAPAQSEEETALPIIEESSAAAAPAQSEENSPQQTPASTESAVSQTENTPSSPASPVEESTEDGSQQTESSSVPDIPEPPKETTPATPPEEPVEPEPAPEPEFDVAYWVSFAQSHAQSLGLALDSEAIWCWDTPIVAGSHCLYLERDITDRLSRYAKDGDISKVWVWSEPRGDGSYDLYIGYA